MPNDVAVRSFCLLLSKAKHNRVRLCFSDVILMFPLHELPQSQAHREVIDEAALLEHLSFYGWRLATPLCEAMKATPESYLIVVERAEDASMTTNSGELEWSLRMPTASTPQRLTEKNAFSIDIDYPEGGCVGWINFTFFVDRVSHVVTVSEFFNHYAGVPQLIFDVMKHGAPDEIRIDEEGNHKDILLRPAPDGCVRLIIKDHDYPEQPIYEDDPIRITYIDVEIDERRLVNTFMTVFTEFLHTRHDPSRWREGNLYLYYVNATWLFWGEYLEKKEDRPIEEVLRSRAEAAKQLKIVAGGREGVDRSALDAAMACGVKVGGWCLEGGTDEDGPIPQHYPLQALPGPGYRTPLHKNITDSDATVFIYYSEIPYATTLTREFCDKQNKPRVFLCGDTLASGTAAYVLTQFVQQLDIRVLHVHGPSASNKPGAYQYTRELMETFLGNANKNPEAASD